MRIALVQQRATPDLEDNLTRGLAAARAAAHQGAKLICFSELAFVPFYPQQAPSSKVAGLAEPIPGPTTDRLTELAAELEAVIVANLFERDGETTFDASPVLDADGTLLGATRMVHVPDYEGFHEKRYYTPGDRGLPVYDTAVGRIGVAICYDRHYPEAMRALALSGAELVVVPQAGALGEWPAGLFEAEMRVAAFQNGYFIALCNRVGAEDRLEFAGESFVCDPGGNVMARAGQGTDELLLSDIDFDLVGRSHARRLFLQDRRPDLYPSWLGRGACPGTLSASPPQAADNLHESSCDDVRALSEPPPPDQAHDDEQRVDMALRFIEAINRHDLDRLAGIMAEDHVFIDLAGDRVEGKEAILAGWNDCFRCHPEYMIHITGIDGIGDNVVLAGRTTGSHLALSRLGEYRQSLLWVATIRHHRVAGWRLLPDAPASHRALGISEATRIA